MPVERNYWVILVRLLLLQFSNKVLIEDEKYTGYFSYDRELPKTKASLEHFLVFPKGLLPRELIIPKAQRALTAIKVQKMSSSLNYRAVALNNQGASLLDAGRSIESLGILTDALRSTTQLFASPQGQDTSFAEQCSWDAMMKMKAAGEDKSSERETGFGFVYRQSIHIVPEDKPSNDSSNIVVATAIVFNLALAQQLAGIEGCSHSRLRKAVKLYEYALYLAQPYGLASECILFRLSITNNLGHLHNELNQEAISEKCFIQLLSMLMYLSDCSEEYHASNYGAFFCNVSHLIFPSCSVAASAA
jgi:tetratricopeptide (TPR) repeat protein